MKNFLKIFGVLVAGLAASMFIACNGPQANQAALTPNAREAVSSPITTFPATWKKIVSGGNGTCAIAKDNTLWCWGSNWTGRLGIGVFGAENSVAWPTKVQNDHNWSSVSMAAWHACGKKSDGTLWCWGGNFSGQVGDGFTADINIPVPIGLDTDWASVAAGERHTCATKTAGTLWCWGENGFGQLGDGTTANLRKVPTQVGSDTDWAAIATGAYHTCAKKTDKTIWCWGNSYAGQVGDGSTAYVNNHPALVAGTSKWTWIGAGVYHTCAKKTNGELWCWGNNSSGELGDGTTVGRKLPVRVGKATGWASVTVGYLHNCAKKTDGSIWCWGYNGSGQVGKNVGTPLLKPTRLGKAKDWTSVSAGYNHNCARKTTGKIYCWGGNEYGQLGQGLSGAKAVPTQVNPGVKWTELGVGKYHSCIKDTNGALWCSGNNDSGQLGLNDHLIRQSFTRVGTDSNWMAVSVGDYFSCAAKTTGTVWCWGSNRWGQLGDGTSVDKQVPVQAGAAADWDYSLLSAGNYHACAIKTGGSLWCWGNNQYYGQLGDGTYTNRKSPVQEVSGSTAWTMVKAGAAHTCALKSDHTLWCWGDNYYSQLGDALVSGSTAEPDQIGTTEWAAVGAGSYHTCAIKTTGSLWCWGSNYSGQLGVGTTVDSSDAPVRVDLATDWSAVFLGANHTCATKTDQSLYCWGLNQSAQLGVNDYVDKNAPTHVGTGPNWGPVSLGGIIPAGSRAESSIAGDRILWDNWAMAPPGCKHRPWSITLKPET